MQFASKNTTDYLVRLLKAQKVNKAYNGSLIEKVVQVHEMKIIFPLYAAIFYTLQDDDKKEAETAGEEILCAILYLENLEKSIFSDLKKLVENAYVFNKSEYPNIVITVQNLILNFQPDYNSNRKSQSQGVSNQFMFEKYGENGDYEGEK